jgi:F-type H+-transporting ATPase subunit epsilon
VADSFMLHLLTPTESLFEGPVHSVSLPGEAGDFGVMQNHTRFASTLRCGHMQYVLEGKTHRVAVGGGFVEVSSQGVIVLADSAERPDDIDIARAEQARDHARAELARIDPADHKARERWQAHLDRALNRIALLGVKDD